MSVAGTNRNKETNQQRNRNAVKGDYRSQPVESPLSGTHFACCRDTQKQRNKATKKQRDVVKGGYRSQPVLSLGHILTVAGTHRQGRTETKKQTKKETKKC